LKFFKGAVAKLGIKEVEKQLLKQAKKAAKRAARQELRKRLKEGKNKSKEWNGKYKKKKGGLSGKEGAKDPPSWAKEHRPREGESGKEFAKRILDEKYGSRDHAEGADTEFSKIQKWADRSFE